MRSCPDTDIDPRRDWNFLGSGGGGGSVRPQNLKKCVKLYWNFLRDGGGGSWEKSLPCGRYAYFPEPGALSELHNCNMGINVHVKTQKCSINIIKICELYQSLIEIMLVFSNNYAKNYADSIYKGLTDCCYNTVQNDLISPRENMAKL